jgi:uncharacterized membrane protein
MNSKPTWRARASRIDWEKRAEQFGTAGVVWIGIVALLYLLRLI